MDRAIFLERLAAGRRAWEEALARVPEARMTEPCLEGGWSVKDVVAHVCWSEREMLGVLRERALVGSELWALGQDERNAAIHEENRDRPLADILVEERATWEALRPDLEALSAEDLVERARFRGMSGMPEGILPWRIFAGNTFIHHEEHAGQLAALAI